MSDSGYDFMDISVDDAVEPEIEPDGTEAQLVINEVEPNPEKSYALVTLSILNASAFTPDVRHFLFYPKAGSQWGEEEDDDKKINNKKLMLKHFFEAFGIAQGTPPSDMVGHEANVILGIEPGKAPYPPKNTIKGYNTPANT